MSAVAAEPAFAGPRVLVRDAEGMHVAGLLLARVLERAARAGAPLVLPGRIGVDAGGMGATVSPSAAGAEVAAGLEPPLAASIRAPLRTLLDLCAGGSMVRAVLRGGLRARGSVRALLALRRLLKAAEARP